MEAMRRQGGTCGWVGAPCGLAGPPKTVYHLVAGAGHEHSENEKKDSHRSTVIAGQLPKGMPLPAVQGRADYLPP